MLVSVELRSWEFLIALDKSMQLGACVGDGVGALLDGAPAANFERAWIACESKSNGLPVGSVTFNEIAQS